MVQRPFRQVDVFPGSDLGGNPVAVVLDSSGLGDPAMQRFARWTNLSETTFVLPPTTAGADYRVRIFTPAQELPFAGHPTLGTAHAWAQWTGSDADSLVQECAAGPVRLRRRDDDWAFAAPPLLRSGPASDDDVAAAAASLRIDPVDVLEAEWVDNGPGWLAVRLADAETVLALRPDPAGAPFPVGAVAPRAQGAGTDYEVRAFIPGAGVAEDPVTGSLNAGIAGWFFRTGLEEETFTVHQGTVVGADGLVGAAVDGDDVWIAGATRTVVAGTVDL